MDLIELNEAFAVQSLACMKELGVDIENAISTAALCLSDIPSGAPAPALPILWLCRMKKKSLKRGLASLWYRRRTGHVHDIGKRIK